MSMGHLRQRQNMSGMGPIIYIQSTSNMVNNFKTPAQYHNNSYLPDHMKSYKNAGGGPVKLKGDGLVILPTGKNASATSNADAAAQSPKSQKSGKLDEKQPSQKHVSSIYDQFLQDESICGENRGAGIVAPGQHQKSQIVAHSQPINPLLIQDQHFKSINLGMHGLSVNTSFEPHQPRTPPGDLFDDDNRYYESVSVDLEQDEFNKLQYYKNIINHLIEKAEHQQSFTSYQNHYRHRNSHKGTDPHHNKKSSSKQKKKHAQASDGHARSTNDQIQPLHKNYESDMPLPHNASSQE